MPGTPRPDSRSGSPAAHPPATLVLGVLGGVGSGKSSVARLLAGPDGTVIDADRLAHEALASPEVSARVREAFGEEVLGEDGTPSRPLLARRVFAGPAGAEARRRLERWIHPLVRARILERLDEARASGSPVIVLDVPLLLENDPEHGLAGRCDALVFVDVEPALRDERAERTRGWSPGEVARRESAQLDLDEKRRRADHVIPNNGTPDELEQAVSELLDELRPA